MTENEQIKEILIRDFGFWFGEIEIVKIDHAKSGAFKRCVFKANGSAHVLNKLGRGYEVRQMMEVE